jgi:cell volume regulation protein A
VKGRNPHESFGIYDTVRHDTIWLELRGAVPIYLRIIPALADPRRDQRLFASIFILVIASLVVQGWTVGSATRLLGFARRG